MLPAADARYYVGLVYCPDLALGSPCVPCVAASATFETADPERAGNYLAIVTAHDRLGDALADASVRDYKHRSVNLGGYQLATLLKPGDLWACVVYTRRASPVVVSGGYSDARKSLLDFIKSGRWSRPRDSSIPVELTFQMAEIGAFASLT